MRAMWIVSVLCASVSAQRTFVVDAAGGPGWNFKDLPAAMQQAQHGDVYLIRAGAYSPSATDKGVTLLGGAGVTITSSTTAALAVGGLAAGRTFTAKGLVLNGQRPVLDLSGCLGSVHLDSLQCTNGFFSSRALVIAQCSLVTVAASTFSGGIECRASTLVISRSSITGLGLAGSGASIPGIFLASSRALLTDTVVKGGDGLVGGMGTNAAAAPAVTAISGSQLQVFATGATTARLDAGQCIGPNCTVALGAPAVYLVSSACVYSPFVTLTTQYNLPPFSLTGSTASVLPLPAVVATGGVRGGPIKTTLVSTANDPFALLLGLPAVPQLVSGGLLCLQPTGSVVLALGAQSPAGVTNLVLPVPLDPALRGLTIVQQGAGLVGQLLLLTNPEPTSLE